MVRATKREIMSRTDCPAMVSTPSGTCHGVARAYSPIGSQRTHRCQDGVAHELRRVPTDYDDEQARTVVMGRRLLVRRWIVHPFFFRIDGVDAGEPVFQVEF